MKLYLLTQNENRGFDTYDSCVVAAESEEDAKTIHPDNLECDKSGFYYETIYGKKDYSLGSSWANHPKNVIVTFLGIADEGVIRGIICSSFNSG